MFPSEERRLLLARSFKIFCVGFLCSCSLNQRFDYAGAKLVGAEESQSAKNPLGKPNIVLFQPDDMPWLASWGPSAVNDFEGLPIFQRNLDTPYINRLRFEGTLFQNAIAAGSNCAESRCSTILGRYNGRGIHARNASQFIQASLVTDLTSTNVRTTRLNGTDLQQTLPNAMRMAGYRTGASGKWHLRAVEPCPVTEIWPKYSKVQEFVQEAGFDWVDGVYDHNIGNIGLEEPLPFSHNMEWVTAKAKGFITESTNMDMPFFLYFNPTTPHSPDVYDALFSFSVLDTPAGVLSKPPDSGMPSRTEMWSKAQEVLTLDEIKNAGGNPDGAASQALGLVVTDESLGALTRHMEQLGILENTIILFMSDHGIIEKSKMYEAGAHIPFFAKGPAPFNKPQTVSDRISTVDIAPTVVDIAGLSEYPFLTDGRSFLPLVNSKADMSNVVFNEDGVNRAVWAPNNLKLLHINDIQNNVQGPTFSCLQIPQQIYAPVLALHPDGASPFQLYNLTADPQEQVNLFNNQAYSLEANKLRQGLLCFEYQLRLSAKDTSNVSIEDCKNMIISGDAIRVEQSRLVSSRHVEILNTSPDRFPEKRHEDNSMMGQGQMDAVSRSTGDEVNSTWHDAVAWFSSWSWSS